MELIWDRVLGIQFTKEEDISRLCEDIFNDDRLLGFQSVKRIGWRTSRIIMDCC